ncbi:MAG: bis(5'-nucleosyl)-tetraphosphatase (symmetrical) YqeK [Clostridia bacterium]|nr:bis(5'-nucleosyl)-tetraphosphatase (symmetrical) YqeK [Clostridia bacterium]
MSSAEIDAINARLHSVLTPKRYKHTQGVAQEALQLAKRYDIDSDKAYLAGLLHDCAKCLTDEEKLELCDKYGLILDDILKSQPDLTHSFLGAKIAEKEYGINDNEILDAIAYHTTGRPDMSMLEKIIFIADYIEPNRDYFQGLDKVRELAYKDINKAVICSLENTINYNKHKKRIIHPLGIAALEYLKEEENE